MGLTTRLQAGWRAVQSWWLRGARTPATPPAIPPRRVTLRFVAVRRGHALAFFALNPDHATTTTVTRLGNGSYRLDVSLTLEGR